MTVLVLTLIGAAAWAGEPNETPIHLEFEISPTPLGPFTPSKQVYSPTNLWLAFVSAKPAYVAAIPVAGPTEFLPSRRRMPAFPQSVEDQVGFSGRQKVFLTAIRDYFQYHGGPHRVDPNGPERVLLYAVTRQDAEKMAQGYFLYAIREFRRQVATSENQIRIATENIETTEKRIAELEQQSEAARQALEEFQKTVPYRTESEAHEAIGELDRMLNAAQVEIAGIKARITAIQGYQQEKRGTYREVTTAEGRTVRVPVQQEKTTQDAALAKLDTMFIEESIALRGAQAREQMATRLREQANRFVDLKSTLANAPGEKQALAQTLHRAQQSLASGQGTLPALKQQEPKIPAKVVIYPVQWADDAAQN